MTAVNAPTRVAAAAPLVSVIVPVWNVEAFLRECLESVVAQSIGFERVELILVDDGSTDGSGAIIDEYAARYPNVIPVHEPNSGGPGRPRNVGIDRSTAPYVFFLDGDDYLAPEGLQHLVSMADRARSDIVVTRQIGVGARVRTSGARLARSVERARLRDVYASLNVHKLFRRSFLQRTGTRFPEGVAGGEDGDLMARLYHEASGISIVGDHEVYFLRGRPGSQTQRRDSPEAMAAYIRRIEADRIAVLGSLRDRGRGRDALMVRHFTKLAYFFGPKWIAFPTDGRRIVFEAAAGVVRRWHTDRLERSLPPWLQIRIHCLRNDRFAELEDIAAVAGPAAFAHPLEERGRLYARYPHFRDGSGIPDRCFDITDHLHPNVHLVRAEIAGGTLQLAGDGYLSLLGGATTIELRRWPRGERVAMPLEPMPTPRLRDKVVAYPWAGFDAEIDLATVRGGGPLPRGTWTVRAEISSGTIRRGTAIRVLPGGPHVPRGGPARRAAAARGAKSGAPAARLYLTHDRELRLLVGNGLAAVARVQRTLERLESLGRRVARRARQARRLLRLEAEVLRRRA